MTIRILYPYIVDDSIPTISSSESQCGVKKQIQLGLYPQRHTCMALGLGCWTWGPEPLENKYLLFEKMYILNIFLQLH